MKLSETKKKAGVYCCAYGCKGEPVGKKGGLCHKHYARRIRINDPVQMRYNQFRSNATKRGKRIGITLEEFREWCKETGYIIVKGRRGQNATIDRIDNRFGYHIWNMQIMTNRENARKGSSDEEDLPF